MTPALLSANKLRILLARIKAKQSLGLALTGYEEDLLTECRYRRDSNPVETITVDPDGTIVVKKTVNVEHLLDAMKDYGDVLDKNKTGAAGAKFVGSIDEVTARVWSQECGAGIGTKEFAKYAMKKLADPDFRRFRVGGGF